MGGLYLEARLCGRRLRSLSGVVQMRIATVVRVVLAGMVGLAAPSVAGAQLIPDARMGPTGRHTVGGGGVYAQPLGEFGQNVRQGWGLDGHGTYGVDSRGIFGLRAELGYVQYASRSEPFSISTGFSYYNLESETKSGVLTLGAGPQLSAPAGSAVRPYVGGTVGFARFATETAINIPARYSNSGSKETLDQQTVSSDFILSLAAVGGIAFEVGFLGRGVMVDLGARWHRNGEATYVSSEGVVYNSGSARPTVTATQSQADFIVYRLGILVPLR
jgi:hypothetical protein